MEIGSPLGPTLANAFLRHYGKEWLDSCSIEFKPKLSKRFVDDIFVMFPSGDHSKKFVDYINTKHQYTFYIWNRRSKQFFIFRCKNYQKHQNKAFENSVYTNITFIGVFTNFKSFIPVTYKIRLLETMLFCCFSICFS